LKFATIIEKLRMHDEFSNVDELIRRIQSGRIEDIIMYLNSGSSILNIRSEVSLDHNFSSC
jgi:hypothetical protein